MTVRTHLDRGRSGPWSRRKENDRHRRERVAFNLARRRTIRYTLRRDLKIDLQES